MASELLSILKLVDDPDPLVQDAIKQFVKQYDGDMSDAIQEEGVVLDVHEKHLLSQYTLPCRRKQLMQNWQIPTRFHHGYSNDWETFEYLLSLISDLLHDGVTIRTRMVDAIDTLTDQVNLASAGTDPDSLAEYLFKSNRFTANKTNYFDKQNSDLAWVIESKIGNPISLCIIYMLIGRRCGLNIYGCNYPGHFLSWVKTDQKSYLVDTYNSARTLDPEEIIQKNPNISEKAYNALQGPCTFALIIDRVLNNLEHSYTKDGINEKPFLEAIRKSLRPTTDNASKG